MPSLPLYFPEAFVLPQALLCAQLVSTAYDQYTQWQTQDRPRRPQDFTWQPPALAGWQFSAPIWSILSELHFLNESEPFGFAARDPQGAVYLVFRGTDTVQDWLDDLDAEQRSYPWQAGVGQVHDGFLKLYTSLRDLALQAVDSLQPNAALWVCGHSLGCTLSSLAVLDVRERWPDLPLQHYNFASPRLAAADFAAYYNALQVPTFRLVNDSDLVPQVPPGVTGRWIYQHLGLAITFTASYAGVAADHSLADCYLYALLNPQSPMRS
ncbi:lipase family protein [Pseudomonas sp. UBA2684]|uniref:lipase family protein n=1 Tax=Pseudomonas sp. UBA2684 TaxID=1947311 RepID=UPI000E80E51C|nr:lipase family protein [Pseudomonas sp. UBA2684]HBX55395.1 lipase [Pseudomonas sp.]|tara:strand:+ start:7288 stop:8088 length:801 start_codon:yes stop_codon:yes gene_type:complete